MPISRLVLALILLLVLSPGLSAQDWASSSVLSQGAWRKVSVEKTGVYCLTQSQLSQMGFSDPSKVRIYGAGGKQLSFVAGRDSRDDLYLLPAVHTSQGVIFYAEGPDDWTTSTTGSYTVSLNAYSRKAYYYVTTGTDSDDPTAASQPDDPAEALTTTSYDNRFAYATQQVNAGGMGRYWFSHSLSTSSPSVSFPINMACQEGTDVRLSYLIGAASRAAGSFTITVDGTEVESVGLSTTSSNYDNYASKSATKTFAATSSSLSTCVVRVNFTSSAAGAYLGTLSIQAKAPLAMPGSELLFRTSEQYSADADALTFQISGAQSDLRVWDVSTAWAPAQCDVAVSGGVASVTVGTGSVHEYVAFSPSGSFASPTDEGSVVNQDLHSHQSVNYLVVTAPAFEAYAQRLCQLHNRVQGFSSRIVMVDDIYNEFSAGRPEAPAIRNYIKMLYERGLGTANELTHVLLLGAGSYDNFDRTSAQNVIPTYQSAASSSILTCYCTDDFYGWLANGAGATETSSQVLVSLGRVPCQTTTDADAYVSKVEAYMESPVQGNWNAKVLFCGQSGDSNEHVGYANSQAAYFEEHNPDMDVVRVFSESYTRIVSSTGTSYPMAEATAQGYLQSGCSLYHFTGHAGANNTGQGYFSKDLANKLTNGGKGFIFVGATCQIAPFDMSTGNCSEAAIFNPDGGAIAVFGATRETYGSPNFYVTRTFTNSVYATEGTTRGTLGTANMLAKQGGPRGINTLKYVLLGDPALVVSTPSELYVSLDSINGVAREDATEPVRALESSTVSCSVRNADGSLASNFSGTATVSLYDKRLTRSTSGADSGTPYSYEEWGSMIFSGEVEVVDGQFSAQFILSKEFDLSVGYGRLTAYAVGSDGRDAMGASDEIMVGGVADNNLSDDEGPAIQAWVEYDGDIPYLHATLSDEQGINTSTQGVGHEISLVVDGDRTAAISLNNYFTYEVGSSTTGTLTYSLASLAGSRVGLTIKAWDNLNNSSSVSLTADLTGSVRANVNTSYSSGSLNVQISTDAPVASADISAALYSIEGRKVAAASSTLPLRNGLSDVALQAGSLSHGIYVLHCDVRFGEKKVTLSKKIFIKAQ